MGTLRLYRRKARGPIWQAQVFVGGKRFRFSCHTSDKATARDYADQRAKELAARFNRGLVGMPNPVRLSEVLDRYEREALPKLRPASQRRTQGIVAQARSWFVSGRLHDPQLSNVRPDDVSAFLEAKRAEAVSPRTVNLYRSTLHRIFGLCVRPWLLLPSNPVAATEPLREEPREPVLLTDAQYAQLRTASTDNPMLALFVALAWETGSRSGELLQVEWTDVDFDKRLLTFRNDPTRGRQTKGRRSRTVPLSDQAVRALRDHAAAFRLLAPPSPFVFKLLRWDRTAKPGDRVACLYESFKTRAKALGWPKLRPHDLRHSFVTRKLAEGVPAQLVMQYVGHADLATTMRYTHLVPEHLRAVVESAPSKASALG